MQFGSRPGAVCLEPKLRGKTWSATEDAAGVEGALTPTGSRRAPVKPAFSRRFSGSVQASPPDGQATLTNRRAAPCGSVI